MQINYLAVACYSRPLPTRGCNAQYSSREKLKNFLPRACLPMSYCCVRARPAYALAGRYRLSADVLRYPLPPQAKPPTAVEESGNGRNLARKSSPEARKDSKAPGERGRRSDGNGDSGGDDASEFVAAVDGALPPGMLRHLQVRRRPSSFRENGMSCADAVAVAFANVMLGL